MLDKYSVDKFFTHLQTRGMILDGQAVLLVYHDKYPTKSYILTEDV